MVMCWAFGCNHYNIRDLCKFFKIPKDPHVRRKWLIALRRNEEPPVGAAICSCHFKDGKKDKPPEIFSFNVGKRFGDHYLSPEKSKRKASDVVVDENKLIVVDSEQPSTSTDMVAIKSAHKLATDNEHVSTSTHLVPVSLTRNLQQMSPHKFVVDDEQPSTSTHTVTAVRKLFVDEQLTPSRSPQVTSKQKLFVVHDAQPSASTQIKPATVAVPFLSPIALEAENLLLKMSLERQHISEASGGRFSYKQICDNDKLISLYTGLPQRQIFDSLYSLVSEIDIKYIYKSRVEIIDKKDQLLMTLMKLRQNFPHADLAFRFKVSRGTVSNIVITWIHVLYEVLYMQLMKDIPSRNKNKSCLPNSFSTFTNCRIIIDCTEIFIMVPRTSLHNQKVTYSSYKHRNTVKGLIGTAPNGVITFISDLYPGSTSDKQIVQDCGLLKYLSAGDLVIADKGFLIGDILPPGVSYNIPPFLVTSQFTKSQVEQTETIARARIHVERAIRRMKIFKILNLIPTTLATNADIIFKVVGALTNLQYPLIKEVEQFYTDD